MARRESHSTYGFSSPSTPSEPHTLYEMISAASAMKTVGLMSGPAIDALHPE